MTDFERCCKGKRRYNSHEEAARAIEDLRAKDRDKHDPRGRRFRLSSYDCRHCDFVHIGHTDNRCRLAKPPKQMRDRIPASGHTLYVNPRWMGWAIAHCHPAFACIRPDRRLGKNEVRAVPHHVTQAA